MSGLCLSLIGVIGVGLGVGLAVCDVVEEVDRVCGVVLRWGLGVAIRDVVLYDEVLAGPEGAAAFVVVEVILEVSLVGIVDLEDGAEIAFACW